jgi:hypothetical protein
MDALLQRQRDELCDFEEQKRRGIAFIEGEKEKTRGRLTKKEERMENKTKELANFGKTGMVEPFDQSGDISRS